MNGPFGFVSVDFGTFRKREPREGAPGLILEFHPDAAFEWRVKVTAEALASAGGAIVIETDRVYLPGPAEGTADTRRLGLRVFECLVEPST